MSHAMKKTSNRLTFCTIQTSNFPLTTDYFPDYNDALSLFDNNYHLVRNYFISHQFYRTKIRTPIFSA